MEIKLKRHLPPQKRVEVFLQANPDLSWEEAEGRLSSLWLDCPAKGGEVSLGESCCQGCPHLKGIDYQLQRIECDYEPNEWRLEIIVLPDSVFPSVVCPLTAKVSSIDNCALCRYHRGEEVEQPHRTQLGEQVGWLLCGAPLTEFPQRSKGPLTIEY